MGPKIDELLQARASVHRRTWQDVETSPDPRRRQGFLPKMYVFQRATEHEDRNCLRNIRFTMQNAITEDKFTNTFASGDNMTGDGPTTHNKGWRFATESPWTLCHTGGSRQGHPRYTSVSTERGRGWPTARFARDHQNDKTKVYSVTPWLQKRLKTGV